VSAGPKFCSSCGHPLSPGDSFCSSCGAPVAATAETQPVPAEPLTGEQSNLVPCPGCVQTWGVPGALCPACGSRYGDPSMKQPMKILGLAGVILVGIALLLNDVSEGAANVAGAIGVLSLVLAAFAYASYTGRVRSAAAGVVLRVQLRGRAPPDSGSGPRPLVAGRSRHGRVRAAGNAAAHVDDRPDRARCPGDRARRQSPKLKRKA